MVPRMKKWPFILQVSLLAGGIFTGLFVASWVEYFWGDGDSERASFCTFVELFAGPLFVGSVQALRGRKSCLRLLRIGAFVFFAFPPVWWALRHLEHDQSYIAYLSENDPTSTE
jgi:hypothetical protein